MTPQPDLAGLLAQLDAELGAGRVLRDAALAPMTTFKVGGPADALIMAHRLDETGPLRVEPGQVRRRRDRRSAGHRRRLTSGSR